MTHPQTLRPQVPVQDPHLAAPRGKVDASEGAGARAFLSCTREQHRHLTLGHTKTGTGNHELSPPTYGRWPPACTSVSDGTLGLSGRPKKWGEGPGLFLIKITAYFPAVGGDTKKTEVVKEKNTPALGTKAEPGIILSREGERGRGQGARAHPNPPSSV